MAGRSRIRLRQAHARPMRGCFRGRRKRLGFADRRPEPAVLRRGDQLAGKLIDLIFYIRETRSGSESTGEVSPRRHQPDGTTCSPMRRVRMVRGPDLAEWRAPLPALRMHRDDRRVRDLRPSLLLLRLQAGVLCSDRDGLGAVESSPAKVGVCDPLGDDQPEGRVHEAASRPEGDTENPFMLHLREAWSSETARLSRSTKPTLRGGAKTCPRPSARRSLAVARWASQSSWGRRTALPTGSAQPWFASNRGTHRGQGQSTPMLPPTRACGSIMRP